MTFLQVNSCILRPHNAMVVTIVQLSTGKVSEQVTAEVEADNPWPSSAE